MTKNIEWHTLKSINGRVVVTFDNMSAEEGRRLVELIDKMNARRQQQIESPADVSQVLTSGRATMARSAWDQLINGPVEGEASLYGEKIIRTRMCYDAKTIFVETERCFYRVMEANIDELPPGQTLCYSGHLVGLGDICAVCDKETASVGRGSAFVEDKRPPGSRDLILDDDR